MKYEKLIYGLGAVVVIAGAAMTVLHIPYGNSIVLFGLLGTSAIKSWHIAQLKKRIIALEKSNF
ncbi:MAG: hypothetical protein SGJ00_13335 [bacterium]|nr:hypothetical protein [bacterium]